MLASDSGEPLDVSRSYPSDGITHLRRLRRSDLALRVAWVRDERISEHMQWGESVTVSTTNEWFKQARLNKDRLDYAAETNEGPVEVDAFGMRLVPG